MARKMPLALLLAVALTVVAVPALAANPHFVVGPTFTDNGTSLSASGSIAGLGNKDVTIVLSATGTASITCTNKGGNVAPGQSKTVTTTGSVSNLRPENGRVNFTVTTAPATLGSGQGNQKYQGCPNGNWTPTITDVEFTSATLSVYQGGRLVLRETFTP